jgi:hypothetical protein
VPMRDTLIGADFLGEIGSVGQVRVVPKSTADQPGIRKNSRPRKGNFALIRKLRERGIDFTTSTSTALRIV